MSRTALFSRVAAVLAAMVLLVVVGTRGEAAVRAALVELANPPLSPTKASQLVTLRSSGAKCSPSPWLMLDTRVNDDGTLTPFAIPEGQVLVVTSVDFRQGNTGLAGKQEEFFLFPSAANIGINYPIVDLMAAPGSSDGRAGLSAVVTGVAISPGNPCWGVNNLAAQGSADALVHGYLATDM